MNGTETRPCRALVGGFGRPGMRDLDFGRHVVDCLQQLDWPEDVIVEDLSCSAPLVLHRLHELRPAKVVLVGAAARDLDPPGTLRRYRVDLAPPPPDAVQESVEQTVMGVVDLDHTLAMARHWGGLPVETTVIEVEPAEASFGIGFSEQLATCLDAVVEIVCDELADVVDGAGRHRDFAPDDVVIHRPEPSGPLDSGPVDPSRELSDLVGYAELHADARRQAARGPALVDIPGVALAGRTRPWGPFVDQGGDWFDVIPLEEGAVGMVIGNVGARGVEATAAMSDLRAAVRAYAVLDDPAPSRVLEHLDRLAEATGVGRAARLLYVTLQPATGTVTHASAGGCPPFLLDASGWNGAFLAMDASAPLGAAKRVSRADSAFVLQPGSTLLLFTEGLVHSGTVARASGLERLREVAVTGPCDLEDLCDRVVTKCADRVRPDDDICLLAVRVLVATATRSV